MLLYTSYTCIYIYSLVYSVCVYEQKNEKREKRGPRPKRGEGISKLVYITIDVSKPEQWVIIVNLTQRDINKRTRDMLVHSMSYIFTLYLVTNKMAEESIA